MTNEEKIKKWLSGELSEAERKEFESSEEYADIRKLLDSVKNFKAPGYDVHEEYKRLSQKISATRRTISLYERISPVLKIAAILVIALSLGYFSYTWLKPGSQVDQWIAEQTELYLPDSSLVSLNADSEIKYPDRNWNKARSVELKGEAFFTVKEGSEFKVKTQQGTVTVLGTEFSVKDREDFYLVKCYSGSVRVNAQGKAVVLSPNSAFRMMDSEEETYAFVNKSGPDWMNGESSFNSVPLKFVIKELERQYDISVDTRTVDLKQLFTGSFSNENMEIALKSITLPLNLHYEINDDKIVITVEGK
jgi:ferric-dicitrate binding protein FerR (iron transport regulator)